MLISIKEPWWSAYQTFGWDKGVWGVGLSKAKVDTAIKAREDIKVGIGKDTYNLRWIVANFLVNVEKPNYSTKDGTKLYIFPYTKMEKVK